MMSLVEGYGSSSSDDDEKDESNFSFFDNIIKGLINVYGFH